MYTNDLEGLIKNLEVIKAGTTKGTDFAAHIEFALIFAEQFKLSFEDEKPEVEFNTKHER